MPLCGNCGKESLRVLTTFMSAGDTRDKCTYCTDPGDSDFAGPVLMPSDKKMWPDWIVNPHRYKKVGDTLVATDECLADLQDELMESPNADAALEDAKRKKREFAAQKNLTPLTLIEIEQREQIFREQYEDEVKKQSARDAGLILLS